ncbi:phosphatase PAP2 family protein [Calidithermus chliarophilus]|uniref:phosphatase PAP2 family protein n=1 Tax=Calidithermus chliarophilus TaxID=52023 RepID=UPI0009FF4F50|nr:phosphatase PAP2 family protein [Calidithermus chliarophilus]
MAVWSRVLKIYRQNSGRLLLLFFGVLLPLLILGDLAEDVLQQEDMRLDRWLSEWVNGFATPWLDQAALALRFLGGVEVLGPLSLVIFAYFLSTHQPWKGWFFAFAVGGAAGLNLLAKAFFGRERPDLFTPLVLEPNYSFPSGHATGSAAFVSALVVLAWYTRWRWWAVLLGVPFALLVGLSRVYAGAHYPSDVLGGWLASVAWVLGLRQVLRSRIRPALPPSEERAGS